MIYTHLCNPIVSSIALALALALAITTANGAVVLSEDFSSGSVPSSLTVVGAGSVDTSPEEAFFDGFGDADRTYMQTVSTDFFSLDFVAEVTLSTGSNIAFFGMGNPLPLEGSGEPGTPVIGLRMHPSFVGGGTNGWKDGEVVGGNSFGSMGVSGSGTHRLRLTWDATAMAALFEIDEDYSGGAFTADYSSGLIDGSDNGFSDSNTRIFFGGSDFTSFDDLVITTVPEPGSCALLGVGALALLRRRRLS